MSLYEKIYWTCAIIGFPSALWIMSVDLVCGRLKKIAIGFASGAILCVITFLVTAVCHVWSQPTPYAPNPYGGIEVGK